MSGERITAGAALVLVALGIFVGIGADSLNGARLIASPLFILGGFGLYVRLVTVQARRTTNPRDLAHLRRGYSAGRPGINEKEQNNG